MPQDPASRGADSAPMSTAELLRSGMQQMASGKDPSTPEDVTGARAKTTPVEQEERRDSYMDDFFSQGQDPEKDPAEEEQEDSEESEGSEDEQVSDEDVEEITVTDSKGRKRKVQVDWSDKEKRRKLAELAYGSRKWQAEKDRAIAEKATITKEFEELRSDWAPFETAYDRAGIDGVIDLLAREEGGLKAYREKIIRDHEFRRTASPEEVKAYDAQRGAAEKDREIERLRAEQERLSKKLDDTLNQSSQNTLESRVSTIYYKHAFEGKLGDEEQEEFFDDLLWNTVQARMSGYEKEGKDLTDDLIEQEFARVAKGIQSRISQQVRKKVKSTTQQRKREATENAQTHATRAQSNDGASTIRDHLTQNGGSMVGLIRKLARK